MYMKKKICSQCQREIDTDSEFCPYCGKPQERKPSKSKAFLSRMRRHINKEHMKVCICTIVNYFKTVENLYLKVILTIIALTLLIIASKET